MSDAWNALREQIEYFSQPFPEAAIALADAHREEVTPHLVEPIARVADHPEEGANPDYVLHLYAMHLLASWRETTAYAPLVRLGHHPADVVEQLLGDTVTESYGRCLASVCDGDLAPLKGLVEDPAAGHWARHAALDAIMVRVLEGDASRDEHLGRGKGYVKSVKREIGWWAGFSDNEPAPRKPEPTVVPARQGVKVGRNDPCSCGSGKKYKKCHGA